MRKTGLFLASIALSATLWAESPEKKGLDVINKANAEAYIGFWQAMLWKGVKLVFVVDVLPVNILYLI